MRRSKVEESPPLLDMQTVHNPYGPSLPMGGQLCGQIQPQILHPVPPVCDST